MRMHTWSTAAVLATASMLGGLLSAAPPALAATATAPDPAAEDLLAEAGLVHEEWAPELVERLSANTQTPDAPWSPRRMRGETEPDRASRSVSTSIATNPTISGTGDLPGYTFMGFPFFDANGETSVRVNVGSGNLLIEDTAAAVAGPGVGIEVQSVYNSLPVPFGDISEGWATNLGSLGLVGDASGDEAWFYGPTGYIAKGA